MKYGRFMRVAGGWDALQRVLRAADAVARRHDVSIANVASRYVLEQPAVAGVIIGARPGEREHIADNLRVFSFSLTGEDREELEAALATLNPIPGDCGDEYRKPPFLTASGDLSHHVESFPAPYAVERRADGRIALLERHAVGKHRRLLPRDAARRARARIGDDGDARRSRDRRYGSRRADALRDRQDRRRAAVARGEARGRGSHARVRGAPRRLGGRGPRPRRALRPHPAGQHARRRVLVGDEYLVEVEAEAEVSGG